MGIRRAAVTPARARAVSDLLLGDVVRHVVDEVHAQALGRPAARPQHTRGALSSRHLRGVSGAAGPRRAPASTGAPGSLHAAVGRGSWTAAAPRPPPGYRRRRITSRNFFLRLNVPTTGLLGQLSPEPFSPCDFPLARSLFQRSIPRSRNHTSHSTSSSSQALNPGPSIARPRLGR